MRVFFRGAADALHSRKMGAFSFLTCLFLFLPVLVQALIFHQTLRPFSWPAGIGITIACILLSAIAYCFFLMSRPGHAIILYFLFLLETGIVMRFLVPLFRTISSAMTGIGYAAIVAGGILACLVLSGLTVLLGMAGAVGKVYSLTFTDFPRAIARAWAFTWRHFIFFVVLSILLPVVVGIAALLYLLAVYLVSMIPFPALFGVFLQTGIAALVFGGLLTIFQGGLTAAVKGSEPETAAEAGAGSGSIAGADTAPVSEPMPMPASAPAAHRSGWAAAGVALVLAVAAIVLQLPQRNQVSQSLTAYIEDQMDLADDYGREEAYDLYGIHYRRAWDAIRSATNYLALESAFKDPSISDNAKQTALSAFDTADKLTSSRWPSNGYGYYFRGLRHALAGNAQEAAKNLELATGNGLSGGFAEIPSHAAFLLLEQYRALQKRDPGNAAVLQKIHWVRDAVIRSGNFLAEVPLASLGLNAMKTETEALERKAAACIRNLPVLALQYYTARLYTEAAEVIQELEKTEPGNLVVNYLMANIDLALMEDNKVYEAALKAAEQIVQGTGGADWALEFQVAVATRAGDAEEAEKAVAQLYNKHPENPEIGEQYAYILMLKNTGFDVKATDVQAGEILTAILNRDDTRWFAHYAMAVLLLKEKDFAPSLAHLRKFAETGAGDPDVRPYYDNLLNIYALKYKVFMSQEPAKAALQAIAASQPLLYHYLQGTYLWLVKDYDKAEVSMGEVLRLDPELSKAHFILGNIFFERGYREKISDDLTAAVESYKKSLAIMGNDPYVWFSLAHTYKKMNRLEDALEAFRQASFYLPEEDHQRDYWGVSVHSKIQIEQLLKLLEVNP